MPLRIGCVPDLPLQRLLSFLGLLYEREHALQVEVLRLRSAEQLRRVRGGELDLALVHDTGPHASIDAEPVFPGEQLAAFVAPDHRLAAAPAVGPDGLRDEVLLLFPRAADPALHDRLVAMVMSNGHGLRRVREIGDADVRDPLFAVADGRGITIGPLSTLRVAGDVADVVVARPFRPAQWMPDTLLAWAAAPPERLGPAHVAAREVARVLHGATER